MRFAKVTTSSVLFTETAWPQVQMSTDRLVRTSVGEAAGRDTEDGAGSVRL